ncbi:hypothetical protein E2C01_046739 [Portunus trituberculatus]|uniref:Uncharacterized protein n=1 Tax=Portunus trituberculatus TaxID=210409 RepID=A0A5B7FYL6_PORTR|nr:hypothetical protein [Portunus trituberculatus]
MSDTRHPAEPSICVQNSQAWRLPSVCQDEVWVRIAHKQIIFPAQQIGIKQAINKVYTGVFRCRDVKRARSPALATCGSEGCDS